jgi:hypothetical protein
MKTSRIMLISVALLIVCQPASASSPISLGNKDRQLQVMLEQLSRCQSNLMAQWFESFADFPTQSQVETMIRQGNVRRLRYWVEQARLLSGPEITAGLISMTKKATDNGPRNCHQLAEPFYTLIFRQSWAGRYWADHHQYALAVLESGQRTEQALNKLEQQRQQLDSQLKALGL